MTLTAAALQLIGLVVAISAGVWAAIAYQRVRRGESGMDVKHAADRALEELAAVDKTELAEDDARAYSDAAVRVGAARWASEPVPAATKVPATKLALNMLSTAAMVKLGRTKGDLMIDMRPASNKLRERAIRIVREETGVDEDEARRRLESSGWDVRAVIEATPAGGSSGAGGGPGRGATDPRSS